MKNTLDAEIYPPWPNGTQYAERETDAMSDTITNPIVISHADLEKAIDNILADLYHCGRCWTAWSHGTMTEDDFVDAASDEDIRQSVREELTRLLEVSNG